MYTTDSLLKRSLFGSFPQFAEKKHTSLIILVLYSIFWMEDDKKRNTGIRMRFHYVESQIL